MSRLLYQLSYAAATPTGGAVKTFPRGTRPKGSPAAEKYNPQVVTLGI